MTDTAITQAAKVMGRLGGKKGGKARAKALTAEERSAIARKAVNARWAKVRAQQAQAAQPLTPAERRAIMEVARAWLAVEEQIILDTSLTPAEVRQTLEAVRRVLAEEEAREWLAEEEARTRAIRKSE
jgi:hypothetical protein